MTGAAVTRLNIDGVLHEFSTIPNVREDVTDIILNVKALVVKLHSPGSKTLRIEKEGPGEVTGYDIVADADVEIVNPEIHIADLDVDARLFMELTVEEGRVTLQPSQQDARPAYWRHSDRLRFTPVTKVNYSIEALVSVRGPTMTGWCGDIHRRQCEADEALESAAGSHRAFQPVQESV